MSFQSTLRRTERRFPPLSYLNDTYFNPRSDERSDYPLAVVSSHCKISIHAPTNGATCPVIVNNDCLLFQSTLRRTERLITFTIYVFFVYFNPRSDERSDLCQLAVVSFHHKFQSTLRRTERPTDVLPLYMLNSFQSTLRRTERL